MLNAMKETSAGFTADDAMVELAKKSLVDAIEYLAQLGPVVLNTASLLRGGDDFRAQESYITVIGSLESFTTVLGCITTALQLDVEAPLSGTSVAGAIAALNSIFEEMVAAQQNNDWVMLADLLEYELAPNLDLWKGILSTLA